MLNFCCIEMTKKQLCYSLDLTLKRCDFRNIIKNLKVKLNAISFKFKNIGDLWGDIASSIYFFKTLLNF